MLVSEVFVVPSLLPQYSLLNATAKPLDIVFKDEKVYLKKDVISVTSRMGWIDRGRKVKRG